MKARKEACAVLVDALLRIFDTNEKLEEALTGLSINTYYINKVMEAKCSVDARTEAVVLALCDHPPAT